MVRPASCTISLHPSVTDVSPVPSSLPPVLSLPPTCPLLPPRVLQAHLTIFWSKQGAPGHQEMWSTRFEEGKKKIHYKSQHSRVDSVRLPPHFNHCMDIIEKYLCTELQH